MRLSCLHTHTSFCDGQGDVENFCRRAWEKGLDSLGFSAHAPITKKTGFITDWHLRDDRLEEYLAAVRAAKIRWEGRLRVYLGLEVDYIGGLIGPADRDYAEMGLDYLIGSVHYLIPAQGPPFTVDGPMEEFAEGVRLGYGGDGEAVMEAYWDALEGMIRAGGFDILGHADLIGKNNGTGQWFDQEGRAYWERLSRIAALIAEKAGAAGLVTEVNTGGINRGKTTETYPSLPFLRLLAEKAPETGLPVIISADAHRPEDLDGHYAEALTVLRDAGCRETLLFEGRHGGRPVWRGEPL